MGRRIQREYENLLDPFLPAPFKKFPDPKVSLYRPLGPLLGDKNFDPNYPHCGDIGVMVSFDHISQNWGPEFPKHFKTVQNSMSPRDVRNFRKIYSSSEVSRFRHCILSQPQE